MGEGGLSHHFVFTPDWCQWQHSAENPEHLADQSRETSCLVLSIKITFKLCVVPVGHVCLRKCMCMCMFSFHFARVMT